MMYRQHSKVILYNPAHNINESKVIYGKSNFQTKSHLQENMPQIPKIPKIHRISIHMAPFEPKVGGKFVFLLSISILQNQFLAKYE